MSDIKDALKKLDVNNDDHWSKGGMPLVDVVSHFHGSVLTRAEISEAWPGFTRDVAREGEQPPSAPASGTNEGGTSDLQQGSNEAQPDPETEEMKEYPDAIDLIEQALAASQTDRFRQNHDLHAFLRGFYTHQVPIREAQKRLDERNKRRNKG